ncbi:hypothetical protein BN1180_03328 [Peribacillus simplex]|uniref:Uncharacterized protein n=1 Tax=Peribacillus simplex TaxID=1478 RepID=A0AAN2PIY3_9BACI|nr:hypothetical protein BN1180_03328 [Peribacillus simplex]
MESYRAKIINNNTNKGGMPMDSTDKEYMDKDNIYIYSIMLQPIIQLILLQKRG